MSDRTANRLIVGIVLVLVVGIPAVTLTYLSDRWVDPGPTMVARQIQTLEEAVRKNPNSVNVRLQLAGAYAADKRYANAINQFGEVIKAQPDNKTALLGRGDIERLQGNVDTAAKDYQAIVDIMAGAEFAPEDTELEQAYFHLGEIAISRQQQALAIPLLTSALKIDGSNADALNLIGKAYLATNDPQRAVDSVLKAILFVPVDWMQPWCDPYPTLQQGYTKLGQTAQAEWAGAMLEFCERRTDPAKQRLTALLSGPAANDALIGLAMIAEVEGDRATAATDYSKVLVSDPQNFAARNGLGRTTDATPAPADSSPPGSSPPSGAAPTPSASHGGKWLT